jgi:hypothetical protein
MTNKQKRRTIGALLIEIRGEIEEIESLIVN